MGACGVRASVGMRVHVRVRVRHAHTRAHMCQYEFCLCEYLHCLRVCV